MKKIIQLLLICSLLITLCSCSNNPSSNDNGPGSTEDRDSPYEMDGWW